MDRHVGRMIVVAVVAHGTADVGDLTRIFTGRRDASVGYATRSAILAPASHAAIGLDPR